MVLNDENFFAFDVDTVDSTEVAVTLGSAANRDERNAEAVSQGGAVRSSGAFNAGDDVKVQLKFNDAGCHRFNNISPGFRIRRKDTVINVDRSDQTRAKTHRLVFEKYDGVMAEEVFSHDILSDKRSRHCKHS